MIVTTAMGARTLSTKPEAASHAFLAQGIFETIDHFGQLSDVNILGVFIHKLGIPKPTIHWGIWGVSHGQNKNTGRMSEAIEQILLGNSAMTNRRRRQ